MSTSIAVVLAISLLCLGGVTVPTLSVAVALVGALAVRQSLPAGSGPTRGAGAGATPRRATSGHTQGLPEKAARTALWLHVGVCALQLVPIPPALLLRSSPTAFSLWRASDLEFGRALTWHPLSLDPPETAFALATALTVALFFEVVRRVSVSHDGRRAVAASVSMAVVVFCLVGLLHAAFGVEKLYGLYAPVQPAGNLETKLLPPLLNPNHAAAVACVGLPLLIGLYSEATLAGHRVLYALGAAMTGAVALLTLSRSGIAVFAFEAVAMVGYGAWLARSSGLRSSSAAVGGTIAAVGAAAAGLYLALPFLAREAGNADLSKFQVAKVALGVAREYPLTGIGRGAFASVSPAYQSPLPGQFRYAHVENWPVQLAVELGFPLAAALIVLVGVAVVGYARHCLEKPTTFGALVALVGLGFHDLADFACEYVAAGMVAVALLAIVTSARPRRAAAGPKGAGRTSKLARGWPTPVVRAVAAGCAVVAVLWVRGRTLQEDVDALAHASATRGLVGLEPQLAAAAGRHPAEPYFPLLRGVQLLRSPAAGPHLARAQSLGPAWALNHHWMGRWFAMHGRPSQAWSEFREATRLDPSTTEKTIAALIELRAPVDEIVSVAPDPDALERVSTELVAVGRPVDAASLDDRILLGHPHAVGARVRGIGRLVATGKLDEARADARALFLVRPDDPRAVLAWADLQTDAEAGEKILEEATGRLPQSAKLLQELVARRGRRLGVEAVSKEVGLLTQAVAASGGAPELPHVVVAEIELARKRVSAAVAAYLQGAAVALDPKACLERAAKLAESSGQLGVAETTWQRLSELHPNDPQYSEGRARVRRAIFAASLGTGPSP